MVFLFFFVFFYFFFNLTQITIKPIQYIYFFFLRVEQKFCFQVLKLFFCFFLLFVVGLFDSEVSKKKLIELN